MTSSHEDVLAPVLRAVPLLGRALRVSPRATQLARDAAMLVRGFAGSDRPPATAYVRPTGIAGEHRLRVLEVRRETKDAVSFVLERPRDVDLVAGQFLTFVFSVQGRELRRSYSVSSSALDPGAPLVVTVKRVEGGVGSAWLHEHVRAGTVLRVRGPSGNFTYEPSEALDRLVLVGGGSGITPLLGIARTALEGSNAKVTLLYANRSDDDVIFARALGELAAKDDRLEVRHFLERSTGALPCTKVGRVEREDLAKAVAGIDLARARVWVCGPEPMMEAVVRDLAALGVPEQRIRIERFASVRPNVVASDKPRRLLVDGRSLVVAPGKTLLEGAAQSGVELASSCTMGGCGACKARLVSGEVVHDEPNCLSASEKEAGMILTCVARPLSDVTIERLSLSGNRRLQTRRLAVEEPKNDEGILRLLPLAARRRAEAYAEAGEIIGEVKNPKVLLGLMPSAARGFVAQRGKQGVPTKMPASHDAHFDWTYQEDMPEMRDLYRRAKQNQWDADVALDWTIDVDPENPEVEIMPYEFLAVNRLPYDEFKKGSKGDFALRHDMVAWMLSQFLHGEQGALMAAAQVTESVVWFHGKLYGATQVVDEARHVEVFHRYLAQKLGKLYDVNDNLFVIIDALMHDSRWDMKFLGMQIMIEGLALGAFGLLYKLTKEPLLKELLKYVIQDEARHVHYGVLALREHYTKALSDKELRERQDWAFEVALLMRNRFMAHEVYEERFAGLMTRKAWNQLVTDAPGMSEFRHTMFERLVPNLRFVGLLDPRMEKHYADAGLLKYVTGKNASELSGEDMIRDLDHRAAVVLPHAAE